MKNKGRFLSEVKCDGFAVKDKSSGQYFSDTFRSTLNEAKNAFFRSRDRKDFPANLEVVPVCFRDAE